MTPKTKAKPKGKRVTKTRVYVVYHDFYSHDMFVSTWATTPNPKKFGEYATRKEALTHIREDADDFIKIEYR